MRDATAADSHGNKASSAALESAKKLQAHSDNVVKFLNTAQPLNDITPDVISSENTQNQSAARPKVAMLQHSESLAEKAVHDVENVMMIITDEDPLTDASVRMTARDRSRFTSDHDELTTPEIYGTFANMSEEQYVVENKRWVDGGSVGFPPLNIQQRNAGRPNVDYFITLKRWMLEAHLQRDLHRSPASPQPKAPLMFIHAEPGAGKSVLVEVLCEWLRDFSNDTMKVICCSYTGSAAALVPQGRTINSLFGFTMEEAGCNKNLHQRQNRNTLKKTKTLIELTAMFDLMSDRPWHAGCVVNDDVSQTTVSLLGHIE
jgi:hypothetical protein